MPSTNAFQFIDLFAGVGGFHHALSHPDFGGECVFASDIDEDCRKVYASTWPDFAASGRLHGDITKFTRDRETNDALPLELVREVIPNHDVLCAGFPCQPFSKSGAQLGIRDQTRGTLFYDIMTIIEARRPKFVILENVRNLAGPRHRHTWNVIIESLRSAGYSVASEPVVYSPHLLHRDLEGRPQSRDRVFVLAYRLDGPTESVEDGARVERSPSPGWQPTLWNVEDWLQDDSDIPNLADYQLRREELAWLNAWQAFVQGIPAEELPGFPIWVDAFTMSPKIARDDPDWKINFLHKNSAFYRAHRPFIRQWLRRSWLPGEAYRVADFPASRRKFEWQARSAQPTRADRDLWKLTIHLRPSGIRVKPATYLPALVAITQTSIIGSRKRRITPVEAARLQGLPDGVFQKADVDDATAYRQAGNGVNVGVVRYVARALFAAGGETWGLPAENPAA